MNRKLQLQGLINIVKTHGPISAREISYMCQSVDDHNLSNFQKSDVNKLLWPEVGKGTISYCKKSFRYYVTERKDEHKPSRDNTTIPRINKPESSDQNISDKSDFLSFGPLTSLHLVGLSKSAIRILEENNIKTVSELSVYRIAHLTFIGLSGCTESINSELIKLLNHYNPNSSIQSAVRSTLPIKKPKSTRQKSTKFNLQNHTVVSSLSPDSRLKDLHANNFISSRAYNVCKTIAVVTLSDLAGFYKQNLGFKMIPKSGQKTHIELTNLVRSLYEAPNTNRKTKFNNYQQLSPTDSRFFLEVIRDYWESYQIFSADETKVISAGTNVLRKRNVLRQKDISKRFNMPIGRVNKCLRLFQYTLMTRLSSFKNYQLNFGEFKRIQPENSIIIVDSQLADEMNRLSKSKFNQHFISLVTSVLLSKSHQLVGNWQQKLLQNHHKSLEYHQWQQLYLLKKSILQNVDVESVVNHLHGMKTSEREESVSLRLENLINDFSNKQSFQRDAYRVMEKVIQGEFKSLVKNGEIHFKKNRNVPMVDCITISLSKESKPLGIGKLLSVVKRTFPEEHVTKKRILNTVKGDSRFVILKESKKIALSNWDDLPIKETLTIREIGYRILSENNWEMNRMSFIAKIQRLKKKSSASSIVANLSMDENRKFIFTSNKVRIEENN